jgi:phosphopantothenoylcysteine decarboxylase/phosphopantothenate--cysteine ligase
MLKGKRILVGVTGGIAAYKIPFLVRELIKLGAEVKCILTPASSAFVTPLTLATVSKNPVYTELFDRETGEWANHVELGLWADAFVIAPLTASSLAKLAVGHSDNLLLTTYLSARCPVFVAPAMDLDMYVHPTTAANLEQIAKNNVHVIPAEEGELASGLSGQGRMAEPEHIASFVNRFFAQSHTDFSNKIVLITAGPTYESIDPVRFIGNHSSGKMGIALADEMANRGAEVYLLLGPSNHLPNNPAVKVHGFKTAQDLLALTQQFWSSADVGIFAAAVADYRPKDIAQEKIKKSSDEMSITLVKNPDVLKWAGDNKKDMQFLVGFALETTNEEAHAKQKLVNKNLDLIVMNSLKNEGAGFGHDTNKVTLLDKHNKIVNLQLLSKSEVAKEIVDYVKDVCC